VFGLTAILGTAGMVVAAAAMGAAIGSVHHASRGSGRFELAGLLLSYPNLNSAEWLLIGVAGVGAAAIMLAGRAAWRQGAAYRGFLDALEVLGQLDAHPTVNVIAAARPEAFCAGYLRPTVYISTGALELLTTSELGAVLAHEHHHRLVRDPLRLAFGRIISQALFFVPIVRSLCDRYEGLAELNADRAAVRASAGRQSPLASALLVFDASTPPGFSGISPERVESLLGEPSSWRLPISRMAASPASLSTLGLLIWQASGAASAHATFNLPFLSSQPCVVMIMLLPLLGCIAAISGRTHAGQISLRRAYASWAGDHGR
jgi:hypothetical protein